MTPIGLTAQDFWENLVASFGRRDDHRFDTTNMPVTIATEVKGFEADQHESKGARRMSRFAQFAVAAAQLAADDAKLRPRR